MNTTIPVSGQPAPPSGDWNVPVKQTSRTKLNPEFQRVMALPKIQLTEDESADPVCSEPTVKRDGKRE